MAYGKAGRFFAVAPTQRAFGEGIRPFLFYNRVYKLLSHPDSEIHRRRKGILELLSFGLASGCLA